MLRKALALVAVVALAAPAGARASEPVCGGPVSADPDPNGAFIDNGCAARRWLPVLPHGITTAAIEDGRNDFVTGAEPDFSLDIDGARIPSSALVVSEIAETGSGTDHAQLTWLTSIPGVLTLTRTVDVFSGIAGFRTQTTITSIAPVALSGYTLDRVSAGAAMTPTLHAFHAGADWREPSWEPQVSIGDAQTGDWRVEQTGPPGAALSGTAEWVSAASTRGGARVAMVSERHNYASSVGSYDGDNVSIGVDLSRDVVYLGPFEEDAHAQNPGPGPARHRVIEPGKPFELEPAFTMLGTDADDETWQFSKYLTKHRLTPYNRALAFNSDGVDSNVISTGAKDDMNYDRFLQILPSVRELGFDTFVFDDGWMSRSGDWCPDSAACPEPRWDGNPTSKFRPRFPDDHFGAVQTALRGDLTDPSDDIALGLWMTPMAYHPSSKAFQTNPQWSCVPVGTGTGAVSIADPNGGSNEPGIGLWNPRALGVHPDDGVTPIRMIDYLQGRIVRAIEEFGATYFKFDFLVWVDCAGATPVTMYEYHDEFIDMLDRVQALHPEVTLQIDDTNDYRMFPFETVAHGPSWFLNGGPDVTKTLHTAWNLAPYVPGSALGLRSLSRRTNIDTEMAAAITSHVTFSFPVDTSLSASQRAQVKKWADFYKANRDTLGGFAFPLLADPNAGGWTALQPWDLDARAGWVLAYRQASPSSETIVSLRGLAGVPDATLFTVTRIDPGVGTATQTTETAATLRNGLSVAGVSTSGYAIFRVSPA